jgi:hypothetical protein
VRSRNELGIEPTRSPVGGTQCAIGIAAFRASQAFRALGALLQKAGFAPDHPSSPRRKSLEISFPRPLTLGGTFNIPCLVLHGVAFSIKTPFDTGAA